MPRRSSSAGSEACPVIATGRVCGHVAEQRAERDHHLHAERLGEVDDVRAEGAPAHRRLDALHEHEVARRARRARLEDLDASARRSRARSRSSKLDRTGGWPGSRRTPRSRCARSGCASERGGEERDGARGGVAGVVPALERAHHRRGPEAVGTAVPDQRLHPNHRTSCADGLRHAPATPSTPRRSPRCAPSEEVDGVFACTRKERQISRAGHALSDASSCATAPARSSARAFRDADLLAGRFERGELVRVRGRVERFREQLQIDARARSRAPRARRPTRRASCRVAYRDLDELEGFLEHLAREVYDPGLRGAARRAARRRDAARASCAARPARCRAAAPGGRRRRLAHHAYLGGLLEHTVAVATLALELCTLHPRLDRDLLLSAAIVHDLGKTREFTYGAEIARSARGRAARPRRAGPALIAAHAPGRARGRAAAGARALRALPPRRRAAPPGSASPRPRRSRCTA